MRTFKVSTENKHEKKERKSLKIKSVIKKTFMVNLRRIFIVVCINMFTNCESFPPDMICRNITMTSYDLMNIVIDAV